MQGQIPMIEHLARILCEEAGGKPDSIDVIKEITKDTRLPVDGFNDQGLGGHFYWRRWEKAAERVYGEMIKHYVTHQN